MPVPRDTGSVFRRFAHWRLFLLLVAAGNGVASSRQNADVAGRAAATQLEQADRDRVFLPATSTREVDSNSVPSSTRVVDSNSVPSGVDVHGEPSEIRSSEDRQEIDAANAVSELAAPAKSSLLDAAQVLDEDPYPLARSTADDASTSTAEDIALHAEEDENDDPSDIPLNAGTWWLFVFMAVVCVATAGMMSGLTMGLVSLDPFDMELLMQTDPEDIEDDEEREELLKEKKAATAILPLVSDHHRLLVTLLLVNAMAAESLPLVLDKLGLPKYVTIAISVFGVLVFGEILPSALFTGPRQLEIAALFGSMVEALETLLGLLVIPIARLLDAILGKEHKGRYNKGELKALINLQLRENPRGGDAAAGTGLVQDEIRMMTGAMELSKKTVMDVMVPLSDVYMLCQSTELNMETMATIVGKGHSRLPIYNSHPHDIRGFLMVKNLIVVNPEDKRKVEGFGLRKPLVVTLDDPLLDLLTEFQKGKSHMALVTNRPDLVKRAWATDKQIPVNVHMAGIVTLEDVIENLIQEDIKDESGVGEAGVREQLRWLIFKAKRVERIKEITSLAKKLFSRQLMARQRRLSTSSGVFSHEASPWSATSGMPQGAPYSTGPAEYVPPPSSAGGSTIGGGTMRSNMGSGGGHHQSAGILLKQRQAAARATYIEHQQADRSDRAAHAHLQSQMASSNFPPQLTQALLQTRSKLAAEHQQHRATLASPSPVAVTPPLQHTPNPAASEQNTPTRTVTTAPLGGPTSGGAASSVSKQGRQTTTASTGRETKVVVVPPLPVPTSAVAAASTGTTNKQGGDVGGTELVPTPERRGLAVPHLAALPPDRTPAPGSGPPGKRV
ncbi:unnamed protein product [Amoebophrya sp. A25]|nr:unnamed protein product [Amoebophrya sp. A25]|eukprot:GSA25T00002734001.1